MPFPHYLRAAISRYPVDRHEGAEQEAMVLLTLWGSQSMYPVDWPDPEHEDATSAEAEVRTIYEYVAAEFGRRGVAVE